MVSCIEPNVYSFICVFSPHQKSPMPTSRTYYPPLPKIPVGDVLCTNPCVLQDPDPRPHTYGVRMCSCAASATNPCRPTACTTHATNLPSSLTDHLSLLILKPRLHDSSFFILNWPHTFSAKERDTETGLTYFGARYYSSDLSIWLSVDPMSDKYPSLSPYVYCADNPVKLVDPNGEDWYEKEGKMYYTTQYTSEKAFKESGIEGQYRGKFFIENGKYYSLFGQILDAK